MGYDRDDFNTEDELSGIVFTDTDEMGSNSGADAVEYDEEAFYSNHEKGRVEEGRRRKKKRKKKRYLLKFIIFLFVLAALLVFLRSDFFNIENISVKDNSHYTEEQIIKISGITTGDNMFAFTLGSIKKKMMTDPYIKSVDVKRVIPDGFEISVNERSEKIVIQAEDKYLVADHDGMILRMADEAPDLTIIENLTAKDPEPGAALEVTDAEILTDTLNLLKNVEDSGLYFKKISVSKHSVRAYIYDSLLVEGSYDGISNNLGRLADVVEDLNSKKVKRGTIKVSDKGKIFFQPEIDTKNT